MPQLTEQQYEDPPRGSGCARILAICATRPMEIITVQEDPAHHLQKQRSVSWTNHRTQTNAGLPGGKVQINESMDEAFLREGDEEALGNGEFVNGKPIPSLQLRTDETLGICTILRRKKVDKTAFDLVGEVLGVSPFFLNLVADGSEHRLYIVLMQKAGEQLRSEGLPQESLPPAWTSVLDLFTHSSKSTYHFTHRVLAAHGYLYFLKHILPRLEQRIEELAGFRGSREEFEANEAAKYFLSRCPEKFQR